MNSRKDPVEQKPCVPSYLYSLKSETSEIKVIYYTNAFENACRGYQFLKNELVHL